MGKKISVISSTITLAILIFSLVLNMNASKVGSEILEATWKAIVPQGLVSEDININEWIEKYFGSNNSGEDTGNIIDIGQVKEMFEKFKETTGEKTEEAKEEYGGLINKYLEDQEQNMSPTGQVALNIFRFLSNVKIKYILLLLIVLTICGIAFNENSYHKWIKNLAWAMAMSGVATIFLCEAIKKYIFNYMKLEVTLNSLLDPAQYLILGAIIIRLLYLGIECVSNINKKVDKEEKDEISEVPTE